MSDSETEITLGAGRLLGLFFGLVVVCAAFFVLGYRLGKGSNAPTTLTDTVPASTSATVKPTASQGTVPVRPNCASTPEGCAPAQPAADTNNVVVVSPATATAEPGSKQPTAAPAQASPAPAPEVAKPVPSTGGYIVQVAAVSKQQDAEALVAALRRKQYPVFVVSPGTDPLFHVQIGPFSEAKDAESVKSRLVNDGYNPIVKK